MLGASGRTGQRALQAALEKGWSVSALVRSPNKLSPHPKLEIIQGLPTDQAMLKKGLEGCQAALSILNVSRTSDFPWAPLRTPPTLMSDTMQLLLPLMEAAGMKKLVVCSAWGVAESREDIPGWFRWLIEHSNIGPAYRDHERQEALIQASALDWTLVRPTALTPGRKPQPVKETFGKTPKPSLTISRASLGQYLIEALERQDVVRQTVAISRA